MCISSTGICSLGCEMPSLNNLYFMIQSWYCPHEAMLKLDLGYQTMGRPWGQWYGHLSRPFLGSNFCSALKQQEVAVVLYHIRYPHSSLPLVSSLISHQQKMRVSFHVVLQNCWLSFFPWVGIQSTLFGHFLLSSHGWHLTALGNSTIIPMTIATVFLRSQRDNTNHCIFLQLYPIPGYPR